MKLVAGSTHVLVERTAATQRGAATLLATSDQKLIAKVIAAFELVDPVTKVADDGEEIITLPCFCVGEYAVTFSTSSGEQKIFSLKNSVTEVLPPDFLGLSYPTDIRLSQRSTGKLRGLIKKSEKKANKPVETTSVTRPEIRNSLSLAVAPSSVSHG